MKLRATTTKRPKAEVTPTGAGDKRESSETVTARDGTRLFLRRRRGPSPHVATAILCDGILCDGFIWKHLWSDLAEVLDVAHWHYRGHGRSGAPADPAQVGMDAHSADLASVRQHLGDPPCVLIGHSMGTQVVLEQWNRHRDKVRALVLLCGSYGKVTHSFRGLPFLDVVLPKLMRVVDRQPELVRAIWTRIPPEMAFKAALLMGEVDPEKFRREDFLHYADHVTHVDFQLFLRMLRAAGEHSAERYLDSIDVPTLVVAGERDSFTPASLSAFLAETIPGAKLLLVGGGSHVVPLEQPALINARIKSFVERVLSES